jgi:hypothetical protein
MKECGEHKSNKSETTIPSNSNPLPLPLENGHQQQQNQSSFLNKNSSPDDHNSKNDDSIV